MLLSSTLRALLRPDLAFLLRRLESHASGPDRLTVANSITNPRRKAESLAPHE